VWFPTHGAGGNIKASADFTQNGRKQKRRFCSADRLRATSTLLSLGAGPLGYATWGPFFDRAPMSDDDETYTDVAYASHFDMDDAFCARMHIAIAAGLEHAPIGSISCLARRPDAQRQVACAACAKRPGTAGCCWPLLRVGRKGFFHSTLELVSMLLRCDASRRANQGDKEAEQITLGEPSLGIWTHLRSAGSLPKCVIGQPI
jgi:hypothetical protein